MQGYSCIQFIPLMNSSDSLWPVRKKSCSPNERRVQKIGLHRFYNSSPAVQNPVHDRLYEHPPGWFVWSSSPNSRTSLTIILPDDLYDHSLPDILHDHPRRIICTIIFLNHPIHLCKVVFSSRFSSFFFAH